MHNLVQIEEGGYECIVFSKPPYVVPDGSRTKTFDGFTEANATEETPLNSSNGNFTYDYDMDSFLNETSKYTISKEDSSINQDEIWEYPGWGTVTERKISKETLPAIPVKHRLSVFQSTAVAGNDLLASVLYTTGIVCAACGQLAPIAMLVAVLALYPFRKIFQENGTALPLNGGVYVGLLNSSSKLVATFAASCSLIAYSATAVVSAASCTSYAAGAFGAFPVLGVTVAILAAFAVLVFFGIKDSATVASAIFFLHLCTLAVLMAACAVEMARSGGAMLVENWSRPLPRGGDVGLDLFFGYSVSLLGLTGFETAANYIEEAGPFTAEPPAPGPAAARQPSVFERTMNNMYGLVVLVNPALILLALGTVDLATITEHPNNILSVIGLRVGGQWLSMLVSLDAVVVLSGGVLTAYVGVVGLIRQLAHDRCLPQFLTHTNQAFHSNHWIILTFFLLCSTLYFLTAGDVTVLSGVFSLAFLLVLLCFAGANMTLKVQRPRLPRAVRQSWPAVLLGFGAMLAGFVGVAAYRPQLLGYFLLYLAFYLCVILLTFQRVLLAKGLLYFCRQVPLLDKLFASSLVQAILRMKKFSVVFFTETADIHVLNEAALYAKNNENCDHLIIAHIICSSSKPHVPMLLKENLPLLDHMYPKMKIDLLLVECDQGFCPQIVRLLSNDLKVSTSFMFMRCPGSSFPYNIAEFDGVRTIMQ